MNRNNQACCIEIYFIYNFLCVSKCNIYSLFALNSKSSPTSPKSGKNMPIDVGSSPLYTKVSKVTISEAGSNSGNVVLLCHVIITRKYYSILICVGFQLERVDLVIAHFGGKEVSNLVLVERTVPSRVVQCLRYSLIIGESFFFFVINISWHFNN